jgi:hypothetical protein
LVRFLFSRLVSFAHAFIPMTRKKKRKSDAFIPGQPYNVKFNIHVTQEGVWELADNEDKSILQSLKNDSDRAAAIIAGSMIETRLETSILCRTQRDPVIENRLFQPSGPLGSFATKIELACLLGLITRKAFDDLVIVKDIRNDFAHRLDIKDFQTQSILDRTKNLKLIETHVGNFTGAKGEVLMRPQANTGLPRLNVHDYHAKKKQPRTRYLMTIQLFIVCLIGGNIPNAPTPFI